MRKTQNFLTVNLPSVISSFSEELIWVLLIDAWATMRISHQADVFRSRWNYRQLYYRHCARLIRFERCFSCPVNKIGGCTVSWSRWKCDESQLLEYLLAWTRWAIFACKMLISIEFMNEMIFAGEAWNHSDGSQFWNAPFRDCGALQGRWLWPFSATVLSSGYKYWEFLILLELRLSQIFYL